jgi:hypothetical protein
MFEQLPVSGAPQAKAVVGSCADDIPVWGERDVGHFVGRPKAAQMFPICYAP